MKEERINHEIERTLESFDGIQKADPGHYFYQRLVARRSIEKAPGVFAYWKPVLAMLVIINGLTVGFLRSDLFTNEDHLDTLATEYFGEQSTSEFSELAINE